MFRVTKVIYNNFHLCFWPGCLACLVATTPVAGRRQVALQTPSGRIRALEGGERMLTDWLADGTLVPVLPRAGA